MGGKYELVEYYDFERGGKEAYEKCVFKGMKGLGDGELHIFNYPIGFRITYLDKNDNKLFDITKPIGMLEDVSKYFDEKGREMKFTIKERSKKKFSVTVTSYPLRIRIRPIWD